MSLPTRTFFGMLVLTFVVAALAGWLGVRYGMQETRPDLDTLVHERLGLSGEQARRIEAIEAHFAGDRRRLQDKMRAANADLAKAIVGQHRYGPDAKKAVGRFHRAMIELQEDTIRHVLAMRAVLTPDQAKEFDKLLADTLTSGTP
jgi:hypothetical protein